MAALYCILLALLASCDAQSTALKPSSRSVAQTASSSFPYPQSITTRYAASVTRGPQSTYALPYSAVSSRFNNLSTTSYPNWTPPLLPSPSPTQSKYDTAAFSNLWNALNPVNFTRGIYSTTVSPTAVPTSELIYPPPLVFNVQNSSRQFPQGFVLGAAGSSAQCEGAVADQGKSPSLLDALYTLFKLDGALLGSVAGASPLVPTGSLSPDYTTNEHYYLYKQDIERFASIGLKQYSFSIPMGRIVPFASPGSPVNSLGLQHYSDLVDFVIQKGLEPIVTLYHWETPLQFYGGGSFPALAASLAGSLSNHTYGLVPGFSFGFQNATFEDAYVNYAQIVMSHLGDRVPRWVTFNEPQVGSTNGAAVNTVLKAHSRTVQFYRNVLNGTGQVSMKMATPPAFPQDASNAGDIEAANIYNDVYIGPFLRPLVLGEDYPDAFKTAVPDYVPLTKTDLASMKNTLDYISVDVYAPTLVTPLVSDYAACAANLTSPDRRYPICLNTSTVTTTGWAQGWTDNSGSPLLASSLRTQLRYLYETYRKPIMISETGSMISPPRLLEQNLANYPQSIFLVNELDQILASIYEDNVDVVGMLVWNWGDDLEFVSFDAGFGLQYVNHTTQERRYRRSFFDVVDFVESRRETS